VVAVNFIVDDVQEQFLAKCLVLKFHVVASLSTWYGCGFLLPASWLVDGSLDNQNALHQLPIV
jgi:hypothetical protein